MNVRSTVGILTDSSVQFPKPSFPGLELIHIMPLPIRLAGKKVEDSALKLRDYPLLAYDDAHPVVEVPTPAQFCNALFSIEQRYSEIVVILLSARFSRAVENAQLAATMLHSSAKIQVVDSQNIALGLGLLVQAAAEAALEGGSASDIKHYLNGLIPKVYSAFCIQSLSYLYYSGQLDRAQSIVGELLDLSPFFALEHGRLVATYKSQNSHQIVHQFLDYASEFTSLKRLAILQSSPHFDNEVRLLRERIQDIYPNIPLSEHALGPILGAMLGPRSLGMVAMEG